VFIGENPARFFDRFLGNIAVHGDSPESERLDICAENRIAIAKKRLFVVNRFQKRVSKSFIRGGKGDQIGLVIGVPDREAFAAVFTRASAYLTLVITRLTCI
jgi:hypothetical protein